MVLRKSVYGAFMACNKYPKCRNIESLENKGAGKKKAVKKKKKKKAKKKAKK